MSLLGLDIGTTGCKAIVFREDGTILGQASREYAILTPRPDWAEQDAEEVWRLACESICEAAGGAGEERPAALALSVQGEAVIPVDREGRALRPAILGMDTRTTKQNDWLAERFGPETLFERTGMPLHTVNTLPKLLWIKSNEPDVWTGAEQYLLYEDFFLSRLTGKATISHCLASRTQMYDLAAGEWAGDILGECGIDCRRLAPLAPPGGGVIGTVQSRVARELGLAREAVVAAGGHDQACAAVGAGAVRPGRAMVSTGTAEVIEVAMESPALAAPLREGNISIYRHVVPNQYLAMTLNHCGGLLLRWYRDAFCGGERRAAARTGDDPYDLILANAPDGPTGTLVLPHFAGSGTPWMDTSSKGAFVGLSFDTDRATLAKAILEGVTFELRVNVDLLREGGVRIQELHAVGGGARSALWLQLKADVCGLPLRIPQVTEAACLGAALLAGAASGVYRDLPAAVDEVIRFRERIEPDPARQEQYEERYQLYRDLYPRLRPLLHRM